MRDFSQSARVRGLFGMTAVPRKEWLARAVAEVVSCESRIAAGYHLDSGFGFRWFAAVGLVLGSSWGSYGMCVPGVQPALLGRANILKAFPFSNEGLRMRLAWAYVPGTPWNQCGRPFSMKFPSRPQSRAFREIGVHYRIHGVLAISGQNV